MLSHFRLQPVLQACVVDVTNSAAALAHSQEWILRRVGTIPTETTENIIVLFFNCRWLLFLVLLSPVCCAVTLSFLLFFDENLGLSVFLVILFDIVFFDELAAVFCFLVAFRSLVLLHFIACRVWLLLTFLLFLFLNFKQRLVFLIAISDLGFLFFLLVI